MEQLGDDYGMALILDADNIMAQNAMLKMACKYVDGYFAIQGHRCAKNANTQFAILDGLSEEINNHIYCKGPSSINLSSRLVGSGMAFNYKLFKRLMKTIDATGGFDKELELKLIKEGIRIEYLESALIYDEKIESREVFEKQRTRWISAQYHFLWKTIPTMFKELLKGNFDYFYKAIQLALPPRLLLPVFLLIGALVFKFIGNDLFHRIWTSIFFANVIAYIIAIPNKFWNRNLWRGVMALPGAIFSTVSAIMNLRGANKNFIHTPHSVSKSSEAK